MGIELDIAVKLWAAFFVSIFDFVDKIRDFVFLPLTSILSYFKFEIQQQTKNAAFIVFLASLTYISAGLKVGKKVPKWQWGFMSDVNWKVALSIPYFLAGFILLFSKPNSTNFFTDFLNFGRETKWLFVLHIIFGLFLLGFCVLEAYLFFTEESEEEEYHKKNVTIFIRYILEYVCLLVVVILIISFVNFMLMTYYYT